MPVRSPLFLSRRARSARLALVLALCGAGGIATYAADEQNQPPSLSEKVSEGLRTKMNELAQANNWDGALELINGLLAGVPADSYDAAFLLDMKAKVYLRKNEFSKSIEFMEAAIHLGELHKNYFEQKATLDTIYLLAQIYYQEASTLKSPAQQHQYYNKATEYIKRWLDQTPKANTEAYTFYAGLLYNKAVVNPEKVDTALLRESEKITDQAILSSTRPKESLYMLKLAALQQQGDYAGSVDILELLVAQNPNNKTYWQQLLGMYLNLAAANEKNEGKFREYYARAINAVERAQSFGHLKTPKDNYNLITIYFNVGQFGRATELLYTGLKNGSIEPDIKNWQLLAYCYQQVNQDLKAVEVLKEAMQIYPKVGQLDFQIGQIFSQLDKTPEASKYYAAAAAKGGVEKPYLVYMNLAYSLFEQEKFQDALKAIQKAGELPESKKDGQFTGLRRAIEDSIKEREAAKEDAAKAKEDASKAKKL